MLPQTSVQRETNVQPRACGHAIRYRRPRRPAHAAPLRGGFGPDTLPTPPAQSHSSKPITGTHHHSHHLTQPARPHTTRPKSLAAHEPHGAHPDPRQPSQPAPAEPPRQMSASSKKTRRPTSLSSSAPLCKLIFSSTLHRHDRDVGSSPDHRPELVVDVLDAHPRSNWLSATDPTLLRHSGRQVSAMAVDGVWLESALNSAPLQLSDAIRSSTVEGASLTCGAVATGQVSAGVVRRAGAGDGSCGGFAPGQSIGSVRGSPKASSRG